MSSSQAGTQTHIAALVSHTLTTRHCLLQETENCLILIWLPLTIAYSAAGTAGTPAAVIFFVFQLHYNVGTIIPILQIKKPKLPK